MNNKFEKVSKESIVDQTSYCSRICLEEMVKNTKMNLRIASVPTEIRKEHLPNEYLKRCSYVSLLGLTGLGRVVS